MKLISCHIAGFGKLKNYDITFDPSLNAYCEPNGRGKSTVAAFIKAMLYGMPSYRVNTADFTDRMHFCPFDGGIFGGNLVFENGGKTYKIERAFDSKTGTKDTLNVYCDGAPIKIESVGEEILGIDSDAYDRTIFIQGEDLKPTSTGSVNGKLRGFNAGVIDNNNFEAAIKALEDKKKVYKKSKGNALINQHKEKIASLNDKIKNVQTIYDGLSAKHRNLAAIDKNIEQLAAKVTEAQTLNITINNWNYYDAINEDIEKTEAKLSAIVREYPFGLPSGEELEAVSAALNKDKTLRAKMSQKTFTDDDAVQLAILNGKFKDGVPTDEECASAKADAEELTKLKFSADELQNVKTTEKEKELCNRFALKTPTQEELDSLNEKTKELLKAKAEYDEIPPYVLKTKYVDPAPVKNKNLLLTILALVSAAIAIAGVVAIFFVLVAGVAMLIAGAIGLIASAILVLSKKKEQKQKPQRQVVTEENPEKTQKRLQVANLQLEVRALPIQYQYNFDFSEEYTVKCFCDDVAQYAEFKRRVGENAAVLNQKLKKIKAIETRLNEFFAKYKMSGDSFANMAAKLSSDIEKYNELTLRKSASEMNADELDNQLKQNAAIMSEFCDKYKFSADRLDENVKMANARRADYLNLQAMLANLIQKAEQFKAAKNLTSRPDGELEDISALNAQINNLQQERTNLLSVIISDEQEAERLDDLKSELSVEIEKLDDCNKKFELLDKTEKALCEADNMLKQKYLAPIKNSFEYYAKLLQQASFDRPVITANLEYKFEYGGIERSWQHLSSGQRSMCALCLRLALIDNMYGDDRPFVLLDDPFTYMDEDNLKGAKTLLPQLAEKFQILYFCCHPSRKI